MANRAGLRKVTKSVKGKKGTVQRSYWVKASSAVKGAAKSAGKFIGKHKGKIAAGAGLALGAAAAYKGIKTARAYKSAGMGTYGSFLKNVAGGLKDRAKGAATSGAHSIVGAAAKAHKAASDARGAARNAADFVKGGRAAGMSRSSIAKNAMSGIASRAGGAIASGARAAGSRVRKAVSRNKAN